MTTCTRQQDIDCGHRVVRQGGQCERLHGHTYSIFFTCEADQLNDIGMVIDFGVMKSGLCQWVLDHWDHKFLVWENDPVLRDIFADVSSPQRQEDDQPSALLLLQSIVWVPFNPTAENIAEYLMYGVGPEVLAGSGVRLVKVKVMETRKCSAEAA